MTAPSHTRLRQLFDQAFELPAAARDAFLSSACAGDDSLQRRLEAMLAAADDQRFLAEPTAAPAANPGPTTTTDDTGTQIGPYRLLQKLGEGGFGAVFLAEQNEPVHRRVALKLIKVGMDTRQFVARFEQERQALAMMDHPNIARVLDAGATDTGRPFFVMDLVKGQPIVDYCDHNHLTIPERLALFEQVCAAVQHAHGKGIIHRDLKPSNVLVGTQDGAPVAKVIDFGIAKATQQKLTDKTLFTEHQQVIGTLQYMSPEQAEGSPDIDTRTDIWSLGVLLYELLTGSTPFDGSTTDRGVLGELHRAIREVDPPRPSTRLSASRERLPTLAAQRRVEPRRLGMLLRGELDWIVMKALEKDRVRRYETANSMAADIRRFLTGEAVLAAPPGAGYRLRKFVRRNRALVLATAATAAALLAGVIGFAWQAHVAADERDRAVLAQRAEAEQRSFAEASARAESKARRQAEAVKDFVTRALQAADPHKGGTDGLTVAAAMRQAKTLLTDSAFAEQPEVAAELLEVIAEILANQGHPDEALPLAERSLALIRGIHDGDHPEVARSLRTLGFLQAELGRHEPAEQTQRQALAMLQRLHPGDHDEIVTVWSNLATTYLARDRAAEAVPLLRSAVAMARRLHPQENAELAGNLTNLATALAATGQIEEAERLFRQALDLLGRTLPGDHPHRTALLNNLGHMLWANGRPADAEPLFEEALACNRRLYAGDHPETAIAMANLAAALEAQDDPAAAEPFRVEALRMLEAVYPKPHPTKLNALISLAELLETQRRWADAVAPREQALAIARGLGDQMEVALALFQLGDLLWKVGRFADAEPLLVEAVTARQRIEGGDHGDIVSANVMLGRTRLELGQFAGAEAAFGEALAMRARLQPGPCALVARMHWFLGTAQLRGGNAEKARAELQAAVDMGTATLPADSAQLDDYRSSLAECLRALGG
ncbi:MAG: tetratricopeptide repeat protein [Planctomycetes bacterium]|nr:tetratricopeptide repeat protein [Planctomycetota bacterium]